MFHNTSQNILIVNKLPLFAVVPHFETSQFSGKKKKITHKEMLFIKIKHKIFKNVHLNMKVLPY